VDSAKLSSHSMSLCWTE